MLSKKYAQPLRLKIVPSRQLAMFLLLTHVGALMIITQLAIHPTVIVGLAALVAGSLYSSLRRYVGMRSKHSIVEAVWESDGEWMLVTADGDAQDADLLPNSVIFAALVLLNFRLRRTRQTRTLVLPHDSLDKKTFRKLRTRLQSNPPK